MKDRIVMIVDRSGSMGALAEEATTGIQEFLKSQRELGRPADIQIVEFDDQYEAKPVTDISVAHYEKLVPRGMTAMLDAIGKTLSRLDHWPQYDYGSTVCMIVTDGQENASQGFTYEMVKRLIKEREEQNWTFLFMASNIDAYGAADSIGLQGANTMQFANSAEGTGAVYGAAASYTVAARTVGKKAAEEDLAKSKAATSSLS